MKCNVVCVIAAIERKNIIRLHGSFILKKHISFKTQTYSKQKLIRRKQIILFIHEIKAFVILTSNCIENEP